MKLLLAPFGIARDERWPTLCLAVAGHFVTDGCFAFGSLLAEVRRDSWPGNLP